MKKLPIGETIRFAYQFTLGQIGTIIGLIWIPMLIIVIGSFLTTRPYYAAMISAAQSGTDPAGQAVFVFVLFQLVALLLVAMMIVAITQQALGLRQGQTLAHFALGPTELRVYAGMFGLMLLYALFLIAFILGLGATGIIAKLLLRYGLGGQILGETVAAAYMIAGLAAMIYAMVRLSFVFAPAAIDGGGFGISRSWEVTRGNFWRIFLVGCSTTLPLLLVFMVILVAILGPRFFIPDLATLTDRAAQAHNMIAQLVQAQKKLPYLVGLNFVMAPILYGLALAPAAFAYRALTKAGD